MPAHQPLICAIVSDTTTVEQLEEARHSIEDSFKIRMTDISNCVSTAAEVLKTGASVLISRGSIAHFIRTAFPKVPTLEIPLTCCDALEILAEAKQISSHVGVVAFDNLISRLVLVAPFLGVELSIYRITDPMDVENGCDVMHKKGLKVLVGGGRAMQKANSLGMQGILYSSSTDGVLQVLREASQVARAIREERAKDAIRLVMLDAVKDGVISLDEDGRVRGRNTTAEKLFDFAANSNEECDAFLHSSGIATAVREQQAWTGETIHYRKNRYICNINPAYSKDAYCGAIVVLQEASRIQSLEHKIRRDIYAKGHVARYTLDEVTGSSAQIRELVTRARLYAASPSSIFIYGESGTGKEIFAQGIHMASQFARGPFVGINCTALPESLLESELFGYADGAFTGALKGGRPGLFEMAHNGTLFLDEIGEIPVAVQAKLLRVLEEKSVRRIGQDSYIPVNVRIICATNKNLARMVREGQFREDLFYRLNVLRLDLPPLREHPADIAQLTEHFLDKLPAQLGLSRPMISDKAMAMLTAYMYPGNVRELRNMIERLLVVAQGRPIVDVDILHMLQMNDADAASPFVERAPSPEASRCRAPQTSPPADAVRGLLRESEQSLILKTLEETGGNKSETARRLGISASTLWRRLREMGMAGREAVEPVNGR